jgi:hypothetical protein
MYTMPFPIQGGYTPFIADSQAVAQAIGYMTNTDVATQSLVVDGIASVAAGFGAATAIGPASIPSHTAVVVNADAVGGNVMTGAGFGFSSYSNNLSTSAANDFASSLGSIGFGDWY